MNTVFSLYCLVAAVSGYSSSGVVATLCVVSLTAIGAFWLSKKSSRE